MLRNREVAAAAAASLAALVICCAAAVAALPLVPADGAAPFLVAALVVTALAAATPFAVLTRWRYRRLRELAARIDDVLHGGRSLSFAAMNEGELAVLSSELGKMTSRLERTADELSRERQRLADALADISHQLRTPLTSLSITTSLLRGELVELPADRKMIDQVHLIERLQMRIAYLVDALLKLARLDAGAIRFARSPLLVRDVVDRAAEPLAVSFDLADVSLAIEVDPGAMFSGDLGWCTEAIGNVLKNCMEHTPARGTVTVRAREDALACRVVIEDTGPGIAAEDLPHIFERFYRGRHDEREVNPAGVGIGLALARALIDAQGGTIAAENRTAPDGSVTGARFTVVFFKTPV